MTSNGRLAGRVVLVLEDDYFLADDEKSALQGAGATVLGPFCRSAQALEAADRTRPDCAVVDINLGEGPDFAPARGLVSRGVPVVFVTGYEPMLIPADLASAPCLQKPFTDESLVSVTASLAAAAGIGPGLRIGDGAGPQAGTSERA